MENSNENAVRPQGQKGMAALVVAVVVLILVALGLGTAYFFQMEHASDLQRKVDDLKTAANLMDEQMANDMKTTEPVAVKYREIPELGVKYKVTGETKDLTYGYAVGEGVEMVQFSTVELRKLKDEKNMYPCSLGSSGMIVRSEEKPKVSQNVTVKKIGNGYFMYTYPQHACSIVNGDTSPELLKSANATKSAFDSLEAM